ncbi:MAG: pyridoxal phosphate-dependent aminotransferase [Deltaproteobacteria bacterium]|nr:pyridoxal phosphate-dependent aminotransferase [Deltaproteobacteria bacterium]
MRNNIVHIGAGELTYEIRAIVEVANRMQALGLQTFMENIGDPIAKGEELPGWIKDIVCELAREDSSYGYSPTRGLLPTRTFLAERTNARGGIQIGADDILFFNGLGDAIQKVYGLLRRECRVLGPSPTYSTHSSAEAAHAGQHPVSYRLDPDNKWFPDLEHLRLSVKFNPAISGLLIINPDNPTGSVWPRETLEEMVAIAREYDLFLIADEIYMNLIYNGETTSPIGDIIGDVPAIAMKGISKEVPWPGSRCGWIEFYNREKDPVFDTYARSLLNSKMVEVCSTTLPQAAIPKLYSHPEYEGWLEERRQRYARHSQKAQDRLSQVKGIKCNRTNGAFYKSVVFEDGVLHDKQTLPIENPEVKALVEGLVDKEGVSLDKRFVYTLLASTGICVVPLSSFGTHLQGFRMTLLQKDEELFDQIIDNLAEAIEAYLAS